MIDRDLQKHAREFKGALDNHAYEVTDAGIYFPAAKALAAGQYFHSVNGEDERVDDNLITTEGLNHILMVALSSTAKLNSFYLALFSGAYTPVAGLTAATFTATATEITASSPGYTQATRPQWTPAAASAGAINNLASKAVFTIGGTLTIRGAALLSSNVKGGTTGVLISASRFGADRTQYDGDSFELGYRATLTGV